MSGVIPFGGDVTIASVPLTGSTTSASLSTSPSSQMYINTATKFSVNNKPSTPEAIIAKNKSSLVAKTLPGKYFIDVIGKDITTNLDKSVGIFNGPMNEQVDRYTTQYNRFKLPNPDEAFSRGFGHVFFVKPDCNIFTGGYDNLKLIDRIDNDPDFSYLAHTRKRLLTELQKSGSNDFMLSLSNHVASFSINDEGINTDSYGSNWTGYKITYGKHGVEFKTAGTFSIDVTDDKELNMYKLNRLWVQYISKVYRGELEPKEGRILNKILDYAGAAYYILTAEDGETIVFWSKLYGVFPTTIPSGQYAWSKGTSLTGEDVKLNITYAYSFKEDCNPEALIEFNKNAHMTGSLGSLNYVPVYDESLGHSGTTWVGCPYIEYSAGTEVNHNSCYKLRFRPTSDMKKVAQTNVTLGNYSNLVKTETSAINVAVNNLKGNIAKL